MTIVALFGIIAAIAIPQISAASKRANAPVQGLRVHGFVSEARNLARRTNRCVKVERGADGSTMTAQTFSTCALSEVCRCRASALPDVTLNFTMANGTPRDARIEPFSGNVSTAAFADVSTSGDGIVFLADGSTTYIDAVVIPVTVPLEGGDKTFELRVMPATGVVRFLQAGE